MRSTAAAVTTVDRITSLSSHACRLTVTSCILCIILQRRFTEVELQLNSLRNSNVSFPAGSGKQSTLFPGPAKNDTRLLFAMIHAQFIRPMFTGQTIL